MADGSRDTPTDIVLHCSCSTLPASFSGTGFYGCHGGTEHYWSSVVRVYVTVYVSISMLCVECK